MDKVRFGRALGYGARHAAKSLMQAVDAASAPDPAAVSAPDPAPPNPARPNAAQGGRSRFEQTRQTVAGAARQARRAAPVLRRSVGAPVARFSSVLWLEVTGSFFAVIAAFLAQGVWKQRAGRRAWGSHDATKFYVVTSVCILFLYLAVSSFVRAWQRGRK